MSAQLAGRSLAYKRALGNFPSSAAALARRASFSAAALARGSPSSAAVSQSPTVARGASPAFAMPTSSGVWPWPFASSPPFVPAGAGISNIHKPLPDKREYRYLELANRMRVVLVHDPKADKAAAALSVNIGHLSDPFELPGLSHFLEHMLFLGTDKFPDESGYKKYLKDHGGASNASTSAEATTYHFQVHHAFLPEALARFCAFFTGPLFTESATERELNAVNSENARNLSLDGRRDLQVGKHLAGEGSVWRKFGTGDMTTLRTRPAAAGIDVRAALLEHYKRFYSANLMTLSVLGRAPLDELERMVTGAAVDAGCGVASDFGAVPDTRQHESAPLHVGAPPGWARHAYQRAQLARNVYITPVKDTRSLSISWPVPSPELPDYARPTRLLAHLFGHEGGK